MAPMFDKAHDAASYDGHSARYATFIETLSAPLAEAICDLAAITAGDRILDVGTGTGIAARAAAARGADVYGIDLSRGMIDAATAKTDARAPTGPHFRVMDAEALEFTDGSFDAVTCLCAVRHFPDIHRALSEMCRVLRPGGRLVVSFGYARPIRLLPLVGHVARRVAARLMHPIWPQIVGQDYLVALARRQLATPAEPLVTEWGEHGDPRADLVAHVRAAGFGRVSTHWAGHDVAVKSPEDLWDLQSAILTQVRKRLDASTPEAAEALRRAYVGYAATVAARGGRLVHPFGAFFVAAVRS